MKKSISFFLSILLLCSLMPYVFATERNAVPDQSKLVFKDFSLPFDVWYGAGDTEARIALTGIMNEETKGMITAELFEALKTENQTVDSSFYTVEDRDGAPVISLKEAYLLSLADGWYRLYAEFQSVILSLDLYIVTKQITLPDFAVYTAYFGSGNARIVIGSPKERRLYPALFDGLSYQGQPVDASCYAVKNEFGKTALTIKEGYLQTLEPGVYDFTVDFADVKSIPVRLTVLRDQLPGDVDNDKLLTAADARLALRAALELETLTERQFAVADADCDGKVSAADARLLLRCTVGLQDTDTLY